MIPTEQAPTSDPVFTVIIVDPSVRCPVVLIPAARSEFHNSLCLKLKSAKL